MMPFSQSSVDTPARRLSISPMARSSVRSTRRAEASTSPRSRGLPAKADLPEETRHRRRRSCQTIFEGCWRAAAFGNDDVLVTAEKDEGHAAAHQLVCDRKHPPPIEIDVEDRGLSRLGMHGRMFDFRRRAEDDRAHIAEIS